ncbi:MAG: sodium:calcium antiporter [Actinomycetes bacterium]
MSYALLALSFALLLGGAVVFTNAVEWAGHRLQLGTGAVGSILAAVATALPESVIPMIAIISGDGSGEVAIGSILGAPFLLATLAMLLVGVSARGFAGRRDQDERIEVHRRTTSRDLAVFLVVLSLGLGLGLVDVPAVKVGGAILLVVAYGLYVWRSLRAGGETQDEAGLSPLYLDPSKNDPPRGWQVAGQAVLSIAAIVGGAHLFVTEVEHIAATLGVPALLLALVLAPLATELPEKVNSLLWVRQGKDSLAFGNITGAMVFQSMIPVAVGLAFTPWSLDGYGFAAGGCALAGGAIALWAVRRRQRFSAPAMAGWAVLYGGFVVGVGLSV